MTFSERLKESGVSVRQFAAMTGLDSRNVVKWCRTNKIPAGLSQQLDAMFKSGHFWDVYGFRYKQRSGEPKQWLAHDLEHQRRREASQTLQ